RLRALVEPRARVVERVDGGARLEVQVALPVDALQQAQNERLDVVDVEVGDVLAGQDEEVFRQRQLPLAEDGVGDGEQLLRLADGGGGDGALAADRQQQRGGAGRGRSRGRG